MALWRLNFACPAHSLHLFTHSKFVLAPSAFSLSLLTLCAHYTLSKQRKPSSPIAVDPAFIFHWSWRFSKTQFSSPLGFAKTEIHCIKMTPKTTVSRGSFSAYLLQLISSYSGRQPRHPWSAYSWSAEAPNSKWLDWIMGFGSLSSPHWSSVFSPDLSTASRLYESLTWMTKGISSGHGWMRSST